MQQLGIEMTEEDAKRTIIGLIDEDGDGLISLQEFTSWFAKANLELIGKFVE
jgi:hypothetical protein